MERRPYRSILLQIGLLVIVVFLAACGQEQLYQPPKQSTATVTSTVTATSPSYKSTYHATKQVINTPTATPFPTATTTGTKASFALSGSSVWILSCLDGWRKHKIYQTNPYYTNEQGVEKAKDIYVFGSFWLQPDTGALWPYTDKPEALRCLSDLITTVHSQYHAYVCGVIGVDENGGVIGLDDRKWKGSDVVSYTKRAVANPSLLTAIVDQAKKYPYDCIINDIEDGDGANPQTFSQYDALLRSKLPVPLGQTLVWKTQKVSSYWQKWEDWNTLADHADFFILMALDHDSISDPPVPTSIIDYSWIKELYAYMRTVPHLFGTHPIAWELPTYYRLFAQQDTGSWAVSSGTDVNAQIAIALKSKTIPKDHVQDPHDPYVEYANEQAQDTYLFFETATSSDVLAQTLTRLNESTCLLLSFWDSDSGTSNSLGWSTIANDKNVRLC